MARRSLSPLAGPWIATAVHPTPHCARRRPGWRQERSPAAALKGCWEAGRSPGPCS
jgi:hypothetical protein